MNGRFIKRLSLWLVCLALAGQAAAAEPELLVRVDLEQLNLADAVPAFDAPGGVMLPLGELSRLLALLMSIDTARGTATGYAGSQDRIIEIDLPAGSVKHNGIAAPFDRELVRLTAEDIFVSIRLLEKWYPLKFEFNSGNQLVNIVATDGLPLLARLARQKRAEGQVSEAEEVRSLPTLEDSPKLIEVPSLDFSLTSRITRSAAETNTAQEYSLTGVGDLLYGTAVTQISGRDDKIDRADLSVKRTWLSPGAMQRTVTVGALVTPGLPGVTASTAPVYGLKIEQAVAGMATRYDVHEVSGPLPTGWEAELFYNGSPAGYQSNGLRETRDRYVFANLPMKYGFNDYLVVLHGPNGERREERQRFLFDGVLVKPGAFRYSLAAGQDVYTENGMSWSASGDYGLSRGMTLYAGAANWLRPDDHKTVNYLSVGTRNNVAAAFVAADVSLSSNGGFAGSLTLKKQLWDSTGITLSHQELRGFINDQHPDDISKIAAISSGKLEGTIPLGTRLPYVVDAEFQRSNFGDNVIKANARLTLAPFSRFSLTNDIHFVKQASEELTGALQLSANMPLFDVRGVLGYELSPLSELTGLELTLDREFGNNLHVSLGVQKARAGEITGMASLSKHFGSMALNIGGSYAPGSWSATVGINFSLGVEPRTGKIEVSDLSLVGSGQASVRVFEERADGLPGAPVPAAAFRIDGGSTATIRADNGIYLLKNLPTDRFVDIEIDKSSIEDPSLSPKALGVRIQPRQGHITQIDFPLVATGEIDGEIFLITNGQKRPVNAATVELLDAAGETVATTVADMSGYYLLQGVAGGKYSILVRRPGQSSRRDAIVMPTGGDFVSGVDVFMAETGTVPQQSTPGAHF